MAEASVSALEMEEVDRADMPDLQDVSDLARMQFNKMLSSVRGPKDLVIQTELMTLLEHVTPISFLRK